MPLYVLKNEMPYDELLGWLEYLERRPVDWRNDDRTFKLLQAQGFKGKPESVFTSLAKIYKPPTNDPLKGLTGSTLFHKMLSAKGGDRLPFLGEL